MASSIALAVNWVEQGYVPDRVVRIGIRRLLAQRLAEIGERDASTSADITQAFVEAMRQAPLALLPEKANEQHYEVPADFFGLVLGAHRKYSCCWWPEGVTTLDEAEAAALAETCARAGLSDGQQVLELGCGWGSLSLWMAARFPRSQITAVSNSASQRQHIEAQAQQRGLTNLRVITCDFNHFDTNQRFDRVVSVEMFEHLRNWPAAFAQVARWPFRAAAPAAPGASLQRKLARSQPR